MNLVLDQDIVSLTDFARRTREHTAELKKHGRPRVLTHNGKAAAVVLSVAAYEQLAHDAEERRADMELKAAIEAYAKGERGTPGPLAFKQIRARAAKRRAAK
ncbi:MAG: type II toxin-antitoxin system Phd/YefM family antitoxin [Prosthecobacter sp.]|uniref:type II toxin-antitoxin system Phd/YefM family antitoxin n=1 Tax=Prosthecobacter sp. TaxID=1965333 RepID=UPI003BB16C1E